MIIKTNRGREVEFKIFVGEEDITSSFEEEILEDCEESPTGELLMSERSLEQLIEYWKDEVNSFNYGDPESLVDYFENDLGEAKLVVNGDEFKCY